MVNYEDLTEKELKFGYWFITHKLLLRKILIIFLIVLSVGLFTYAIYGLVLELVVYGQSFDLALKSLPQNLVNLSGYRAKAQAKNLQISSITVIAGAGERYDMVAKVKNPNPQWTVESFEYQFITGIDEIDLTNDKSAPNPERVKKTFILPGEEKYLVDLAIKSKKRISQVRLDITNIRWRRIPDFASIQREKYRFEISEVNFIPASSAEISGKLPISQVTFKVANKSAYSFWNVGFYIILFKGSAISGANYITIDQFLSGETRPVSVNWFETLPNITQVQVVPEVNILDKSVYMEIKGDRGTFR